MRVAGYIRVSGDKQVDGTSLDVQTSQIETYCALKGFDLATIYRDPAVSGGKPIESRPEGAKLIADVESGAIQAVVVSKLDRGFRNTIDCLQTADKLHLFSVSLHIIDLGGNSIDSQSPAGRFMLTVLVAAAEMERGMIRDRCNSGRAKKRSEGKCVGGLPFGYQVQPDGTLIPDMFEQSILSDVKKLKACGLSAHAIAEDLNRQGIRSKKGRQWSATQIIRILNRSYAA